MFNADFANKIKQLNTNQEEHNKDLMPLDNIDFDDQYRKDQEDYDLEWLANNIYELSAPSKVYPVGLIQRIRVTIKPDGRALIDDGEMRVRAFMLLNERYPEDPRWLSIPYNKAEVEIKDRAERDLMQLSTNLIRNQGTIFDISSTIAKLIEEVGSDRVAKVLEQSGVKATSKTALSRYKKIAKAPEEIRQLVKKHAINDKTAICSLIDLHKLNTQSFGQLIERYESDDLDEGIYKACKSEIQKLKSPKTKSPKKTKTQVSESETLEESTDENNQDYADHPYDQIGDRPRSKVTAAEKSFPVADKITVSKNGIEITIGKEVVYFARTDKTIFEEEK